MNNVILTHMCPKYQTENKPNTDKLFSLVSNFNVNLSMSKQYFCKVVEKPIAKIK